MASMFDLAKHDARFHKDGYKDGDTCMYRQAIKDYESVDDLSVAGKISDALEDAEVLEGQIAKMKNENMKMRLREHQKAALSRAKMHLPKNMSPNKPLPHDESSFPSMDDTQWMNALMTYPNGASWNSAGSGSTDPHYIDFNGKRYYVKEAGLNPSYSDKACKNEVGANQFIRMAGFNAPDSKFYDTPYGKFAVSEAADLSGGQLASKTGSKTMREKVADAYPLMALMYNMDLMQNADNAFVDKNGNPVFLDNGSTFGFSAQGARNKYYDYDKRTDPFPMRSTNGGLTGLLDVGNNGSAVWNKFLNGKTSQEDLLKLCAKYNMSALVEAGEKKGLIPKSAVTALKEYAKKLDLLSDKYRETPLAQQGSGSQYKVSPADAFWKSVGRPDLKLIEKDSASAEAKAESKTATKSKAKGEETGKADSDSADTEAKIAALAKKHGVSVPKFTKNADGTVTLSGFGNANAKQMLDFVHELNDEGLLPGFIASLSGNGQVQVQSAVNNSNVQSLFANIPHIRSMAAAAHATTGSGGLVSVSFASSGAVLGQGGATQLANLFNQHNSNSGYTAKATQNANGEWQVTLYPTNQKQISKTFAPKNDDNASASSSAGNGTTHSSSSSSSSSSGSSNGSGANSSSPSPSSTSPASPTPAPSKSSAPNPAPQPTITPAQVQAMTPANRQKAVDRLTRMMKRQGCPANLQAAYQATINLLNGQPANYIPISTAVAATFGAKASNQQPAAPVSAKPSRPSRKRAQTAAPAPAAAPTAQTQQSATGLPANIPQTPGAQALLKRYNSATSPSLKATYAAMLSKMAAAATKSV